MTILKGAEIDRFLAAPDERRPIVLIYGPDAGLVSERGRMVASRIAPDLNDPFTVTRLDGDVLAGDPARLVDEARTMPMFGGRRLIWIRAGEKPIAAALQPLLASPPEAATIVVEAGDLKKNAALRTDAERSGAAAVIPCYADGEAEVKRLISDEARQAGLQVEPAALTLLAQLLGGDRAASRAEIRKVCLYCHGQAAITVADVEAVAGDSLDLGVDEIVDAAAGGRPDILDGLLLRAEAGGLAVHQIMAAMNRHFLALHKARLSIDDGQPARFAVERFEPPVFFRRKAAVERQLGLWTTERLNRTIARLAEATYETRAKSKLSAAIASRVLMSIATTARQGARG